MALLIYRIARTTHVETHELWQGDEASAERHARQLVESGDFTTAAVFRDVIGFTADGAVPIKTHPGTVPKERP